jgi:hypothetical protein
MNLASSRRNWPNGRGFERWYGFLGAETNQWFPELVYDSHPVDPPRTPEEGYHFGEDITDKALEFIKDAKVLAPEKPFFLYYAPGAAHAPHHAPKEWIDRFKGRFDMGYEAMREQTLARQKEMELDVPESQAVNIRNRSYAIAAVVDIPGPGAEGVLFAHGARFGGHALYVKDNRLHYVYSFVGSLEQKIVADRDLPVGENLILSAAFEKDGEDPPGVAAGTLSLFHGDVKVGEDRIRTQPGKFAVAGDGLCVGRDSADPVTQDYPGTAPFAFTGGTIDRVAIDVSGDPYVDLEREAVAMMARE